MGGDSPATKDRKSNEQIEREKMASNEKIAGENLASQQANLEWQKQVQQTEWAREDNTYQRTVADARAAGVSPLALQGLNDSGEVVPTEAPQNGFRDERRGLQNRQQAFVDNVNAIQSVIGSLSNLTSQAQQLYSNRLQNENQALENSFLQATMNKRISDVALGNRNNLYETELRQLAYNEAARKDRYHGAFGFFDGMSDSEKLFQLAAKKMGYFNPSDWYNGTVWVDKDGNFGDQVNAPNAGSYPNAAAYGTMRLTAEATEKLVDYAMDFLKGIKKPGDVNVDNRKYDFSDRSHNESYGTKNQWNGFNR